MITSQSPHGSTTHTVTVPAAAKQPTLQASSPSIVAHPGYTLDRHVSESISLRSLSHGDQGGPASPKDSLPPPNAVATHAPERWNRPRTNLNRTLACFWALFLIGMSDATYGAVLPYMEAHYSLSYLVVSLIFLSPLVGYTASALLNPTVHSRYGQRGVALLSPACHAVAFLVIALHPPFPLLVLAFILAGFGNGLADAAWNAWVGAMRDANQVLGFLHGLYGAGATVAPLCATALIVRAGLPWYTWYYFLLGAAVLELVTSAWAFWGADAAAYNDVNSHNHQPAPNEEAASQQESKTKRKSRIRQALADGESARVVWIASLFLLGYVGAEVALGGWIVVFMMRERDGDAFASGVAATGFWLGITVGRVVLGFITPRIGEKRAVMIYLPLAAALELLFWLVPSFVVSAVAVALQGFFLGPLFPAAVVACTKLLPKHLHVSGIGFAAAFGGSGGAIFPFAIGALAQAKGVQVLQPMILALLAVIWLLWLGLPRFEKRRE